MPTVSIIVPVYNVERYIRKCIDSILEQTYRDFELLLVDDGSTDNSGVICDEYAFNDNRIRVIHKINGGVSDARNAGIEAALGEYVVFCDSDDYVSSKYLNDLICANAIKNDSLVVSDIFEFNDNINTYIYESSDENSYKIISLDNMNEQDFSLLFLQYKLWGPYCKLFSAEIIKSQNIKFDTNLKTAEDFCFNMQYLKYVNDIVFLETKSYYYRVGYKELKLKYITDSDIRSIHAISEKLTEYAIRGNVYHYVKEKIASLVANKIFFHRLPSCYIINDSITFLEKYRNYKCLMFGNSFCTQLYRMGLKHLNSNKYLKIALFFNSYLVWYIFYKLVEIKQTLVKFYKLH